MAGDNTTHLSGEEVAHKMVEELRPQGVSDGDWEKISRDCYSKAVEQSNHLGAADQAAIALDYSLPPAGAAMGMRRGGLKGALVGFFIGEAVGVLTDLGLVGHVKSPLSGTNVIRDLNKFAGAAEACVNQETTDLNVGK